MTARAIISHEELQNIIVLGLDVWVLTKSRDGHVEVWCLKKPQLSMGDRGPMLGSATIKDEYLPRWGVIDSECHHSVHTYGYPMLKLFSTREDAYEWHILNPRGR